MAICVVGVCGCTSQQVTFTPCDSLEVDAGPGAPDAHELDAPPPVACAPLTPPTGGSVAVSNGGLYPSTATYACSANYGLSGTGARACEADGAWAGMAPICLSASGGGTWRFRTPIVIAGSSGGAQAGYTVLVNADTARLVTDGKLQATGGDIRMASASGVELSFWIESGVDTASTKIWVKVDEIPVAGTTIYLYYGNPSATLGGPHAGSGPGTFDLFDDFEAAALDATRWSSGQSYRLPAQHAGVLNFHESTCCNGMLDGEEVQTVATFTGSKVAEFNMTMNSAPEPSWKSQAFLAKVGSGATVSTSPLARVSSGWWSNGVQDCPAMNGSYLGALRVDASAGTLALFLGAAHCATTALSALPGPYVFSLAVEGGWGSNTVDFSNFRVRPFVSPEPAAGAPGAEEGT